MRNKILKSLLMAFVISAANAAFADGFVCHTDDERLKIALYNHVSPEDGTRTPSTMIISDNFIAHGRKTIARFSAKNGVLAAVHNGQGQGLSYLGIVDLRFNDTRRAGEYIMGTRLGEVDFVQLNVAFSYSIPVLHGEEISGQFIIVKRRGERRSLDVQCLRYLKRP